MTEEELIIFCIGCLISADNNFNNDQRSENIRALKMLLTNKKVKLKKYHKEAIEKGNIKTGKYQYFQKKLKIMN